MAVVNLAIRGASMAAPQAIEWVSKNKPGVLGKVKDWLSRATGQRVDGVTNFARLSDSNASLVLDGLVRNGVRVNELKGLSPILEAGEVGAFLEQLRVLEEEDEDRVSSHNGGVVRIKEIDTVRLVEARRRRDIVARALGTKDPDTIMDFIVAVQTLNENDLEQLQLLGM